MFNQPAIIVKYWVRLTKIKKSAIILGCVGSSLLIFSVISLLKETNNVEAQAIVPDIKTQELGIIYVDISGAVQHPGIYALDYGERVAQAIDKAGGFREEADVTHISKVLNTAKKVTDEEKIYIPFFGETVIEASIESSSIPSLSGDISVNTATKDELMELEGIGEKRAEDIIQGRPYASVNEIEDVIGTSLYSNLKIQLIL